ncbi:MAG: hypothetical protein K6A36_08090, partial [Paludibacteraceae bacterium]|nr:hypothetical protein [Paludibacteraceae bacterium]
MKKIFTLCMCATCSLSMYAQLAWDSVFNGNDWNNAQTVISKSSNASWNKATEVLGYTLLDGSINLGKLIIIGSAYSDECVVALPQTGLAEKIYFSWHGGGSEGTFSIYQSVDHNNWSQVYTSKGNMDLTASADSAQLSTTTRYLKFAATGRVAVTLKSVRVSELKRLAASTDEWPFGQAMVDDPAATKSVTVTWTNIVARISSTDPHFSASVEQIGQKNQIDQTTTFNISYSHSEAGKHSGEIIISGEGREVRIAVSGETKKYDQTLNWIQQLDECSTTDHIRLNAFASSGLDVCYTSSDSTIAYVENGDLQIGCAGRVTLTASQPGNYKFNATEAISKTITIRKSDPMIGVSVDDITYGQLLNQAVINESLGQVEGIFSWNDIRSDTLLDAGDYALTLLFTPADTCIYNLRSLPVALHVNKAVQTIVWDNQQTELTVGTPVGSTAILSSGMSIAYAYTACLLSIEDSIITPENEGDV